jgi:hypothetical protein
MTSMATFRAFAKPTFPTLITTVFMTSFCFCQISITLAPKSGPPTTKTYVSGSGFLLWQYSTGSAIFSSPVVVNGVLYVSSDKIYAFNLPAAKHATPPLHPSHDSLP